MPIVLFHFHRAGVYGALRQRRGDPAGHFRLDAADRAGAAARPGGHRRAGMVAGGQVARPAACDRAFHRRPAGRGQADAADGRGDLRAVPRRRACGWRCGAGGRGCWASRPPRRRRVLLLRDAGARSAHFGRRRHVGITGEGERAAGAARQPQRLMRATICSNWPGWTADPVPLDQWPGARCSRDFCVVTLDAGRARLAHADGPQPRHDRRTRARRGLRAGRHRGRRPLAAAQSASPRWLKADRRTARARPAASASISPMGKVAQRRRRPGRAWLVARRGLSTAVQSGSAPGA